MWFVLGFLSQAGTPFCDFTLEANAAPVANKNAMIAIEIFAFFIVKRIRF